jgi:hypothetical protein
MPGIGKKLQHLDLRDRRPWEMVGVVTRVPPGEQNTWVADAAQLALELATRMRDVVPEDITILVDGAVLCFGSLSNSARSRSHACEWLHKGPGANEDLLVEACRIALDNLQHFVGEVTTEPWPSSGKRELTPPPSAPGAVVSPNAVYSSPRGAPSPQHQLPSDPGPYHDRNGAGVMDSATCSPPDDPR